MSEETQNFTQSLGDKFNKMMDDPSLFSVEKTEEQKNGDLKQQLITSVENTRTNISQSIKNFREYYIQTYGINKWVEFNKNPNTFGTPLFLVTGVNPNVMTKPIIPNDIGFLTQSATDSEYHTSPSFYKKMYDIYLKKAMVGAKYYSDLYDKSFPVYDNSPTSELYKLFNIDLDTQIINHVNTSNVNERKVYYETRETDILHNVIVILQTFYYRIFLLLCFIVLYVFFLTQEISIKSILTQVVYLLLLGILPYIIAFVLRILIIVPKKIYEYLPANIWITQMSSKPI